MNATGVEGECIYLLNMTPKSFSRFSEIRVVSAGTSTLSNTSPPWYRIPVLWTQEWFGRHGSCSVRRRDVQ